MVVFVLAIQWFILPILQPNTCCFPIQKRPVFSHFGRFFPIWEIWLDLFRNSKVTGCIPKWAIRSLQLVQLSISLCMVVEYKSRDRRVAGLRLTRVTTLCSLVLIYLRKTGKSPVMAEKFIDWDAKLQHKQTNSGLYTVHLIWVSIQDFGSYNIGEQQRLRWARATASYAAIKISW